jgi:hypothetical protein
VILLGHNRAFNSWLALALVLLFCCAPATAQSSSATLSGIVIDEGGAVVPAVEITVFNLDTALLRHGVTNDKGSFVIPVLPPARYNVTVQRPGFTPVEVRNVTLNTGDQLSLRIKLKIGQIGASVTTIAELSEVRNSPSVSTVIIEALYRICP